MIEILEKLKVPKFWMFMMYSRVIEVKSVIIILHRVAINLTQVMKIIESTMLCLYQNYISLLYNIFIVSDNITSVFICTSTVCAHDAQYS